MSEIKPISFIEHESDFGGGVEAYTIYCLKYWIQQNKDNKDVIRYQGMVTDYEQQL